MRFPPECVILTKDPTLFKKAFNLMLESLNPEPASTNDVNTLRRDRTYPPRNPRVDEGLGFRVQSLGLRVQGSLRIPF